MDWMLSDVFVLEAGDRALDVVGARLREPSWLESD